MDEPPAKKCKIQSPEKVRLLEDRLGSILSCCICLDLSTLPMYQVKSLIHDNRIDSINVFFFLVCQWTFNVCLLFQSSISGL